MSLSVNFLDRSWFSCHQVLSASLLPPETNSLNRSLAFDVFASPGLATQPPRALSSLTCRGVAVHTLLHSPRASAVGLPASRQLLPPLSSSHSSYRVRISAARIVVNPCPVRMAPKYSACFLPAAGAPSYLR